MAARHTLQITLQGDETIPVGTNRLQLVVQNNSPVMSYEQVIVRLSAPLGISLKPSKVEITPLLANSNDSTTIVLMTNRPGHYPIKIEANTFPTPKEGEFPRTIQPIEVLPELENTPNPAIDSILDEITYLQTTYNISQPKRFSNNENDIYARYLIGLKHLKRHIEPGHLYYSEFLVYEQQLKENLRAARRFGDTENHRARRSEIIEHLNNLAVSTLNISFNELCEQG